LGERDRNAEQKQNGKDYADKRFNAKDSDILVGDRVLIQQQTRNMLTTQYAEKPLTSRRGKHVETEEGIQLREIQLT
jgi:hypothetical protein